MQYRVKRDALAKVRIARVGGLMAGLAACQYGGKRAMLFRLLQGSPCGPLFTPIPEAASACVNERQNVNGEESFLKILPRKMVCGVYGAFRAFQL